MIETEFYSGSWLLFWNHILWGYIGSDLTRDREGVVCNFSGVAGDGGGGEGEDRQGERERT